MVGGVENRSRRREGNVIISRRVWRHHIPITSEESEEKPQSVEEGERGGRKSALKGSKLELVRTLGLATATHIHSYLAIWEEEVYSDVPRA